MTVSYTDGHGTSEAVTSAATGAIANVNDAPTGAPVITGTVTEDQTLTADTSSIADIDGLGAFSYQWKRDGVAIAGATASTYTLGDADVGRAITVTLSYTDAHGTAESLTSAATALVANVNDAPVGLPVIAGTQTEGQTLTANTSGISDADGLGSFSYQWKRDGGRNLRRDEQHLSARQCRCRHRDHGDGVLHRCARHDGSGHTRLRRARSRTSTMPRPAARDHRTATEDQTLTADTSSIADADGLGAFSYQWKCDGVSIAGATASTYTLGDGDVGRAITVTVSYTDAHGTAEALTSAATSAVVNVNDAPIGLPVVTGAVIEGQTLTANMSGVSDADGLGAFSYQWLRDGAATISGATSVTYTLVEADVGAAISVRASYTDARGTSETVTSALTAAVQKRQPVAGRRSRHRWLCCGRSNALCRYHGDLGFRWSLELLVCLVPRWRCHRRCDGFDLHARRCRCRPRDQRRRFLYGRARHGGERSLGRNRIRPERQRYAPRAARRSRHGD